MGGECGLFNMLGKQCQRSDSGKSQDYTGMARLMTKWFNSVRGRGVGHEGRVKIFNTEIVIMESARGPQKLC